MDKFGLVKPVDSFGQGVIHKGQALVTVTDTTNRRLDTRFGKALRIDKRTFYLIDQQGSAPKTKVSFNIILREQLGENPTIQDLLKSFAPFVEKVLNKEFITASNNLRFDFEPKMLSCSAYVQRIVNTDKECSYALRALDALMSDVWQYCQALRPKPEFRKSIYDFPRWRRSLLRR